MKKYGTFSEGHIIGILVCTLVTLLSWGCSKLFQIFPCHIIFSFRECSNFKCKNWPWNLIGCQAVFWCELPWPAWPLSCGFKQNQPIEKLAPTVLNNWQTLAHHSRSWNPFFVRNFNIPSLLLTRPRSINILLQIVNSTVSELLQPN